MPTTKKCIASGQEFIVSDAELTFRAKQSPTFAGTKFPIPEPDLCPDERVRSLNVHRNEQYFHRRDSCFSGKSLVSIYTEDFPGKICSKDEWFSDIWDPMEFGRDYDNTKTFFENYAALQAQIPRASTVTLANENSEYVTGAGHCRNCYLISCSEYNEDCMYGKVLNNSKDIVDSCYIYDSELLYECFNCEKCYDSRYLQNCKNCSNSWFLKNCIGCKNCFGCVNLRNKEYYFLNQPCSKEEYEKKLADLHLEKSSSLSGMRQKFQKFSLKFPYKYIETTNCENSTGDYIVNSKNCNSCYDINTCEDCQNIYVGDHVKDVYDCTNIYVSGELCLNVLGFISCFNCSFCLYVFDSNDLWYCEQCMNCKDCFGCIGLKQKQYCIFNKQYPDQASYEAEVARIITHMQSTGEWGQFLPKELSPFPYNETVSHYYFPLTKEESLSQDRGWFEARTKESKSSEALICEATDKPFRIIAPEAAFYKKMNLPTPIFCPDERHWQRMAQRNDRKLYDRTCSECSTELRSTYDSKRPEKIVCEDCYLKLVD